MSDNIVQMPGSTKRLSNPVRVLQLDFYEGATMGVDIGADGTCVVWREVGTAKQGFNAPDVGSAVVLLWLMYQEAMAGEAIEMLPEDDALAFTWAFRQLRDILREFKPWLPVYEENGLRPFEDVFGELIRNRKPETIFYAIDRRKR